jgi:hypothetical protein
MLIWNIGKKEQVESILDINEPVMSEPWKCYYKCIHVGPSTVLSSTPCGLDWERMNPDMHGYAMYRKSIESTTLW